MKSVSLAVLVVLLLAAAALPAHAQIGFYVNPVGVHVSVPKADAGPFAFLGDNVTSRTFIGVNFGAYDDFVHRGKLNVGADVRDSISGGNNATLNSFLVGARFSYQPTDSAFQPYVEPVVGAGTSRSPRNPLHITKLEYGVVAGLDAHIHRHVDFRVIEVGYGSLLTISSGLVGQTSTPPSSNLLSFSTGLVFRF